MLIEGNDLNQFGTKNALAVGYSVGLTFDLDLFERAFFNTWNRISGKDKAFYSATNAHMFGLQPPPPGAPPDATVYPNGGGDDSGDDYSDDSDYYGDDG